MLIYKYSQPNVEYIVAYTRVQETEEDNEFISVEDRLPDTDDEVMVIGQRFQYMGTKVGLSTAEFSPQRGWVWYGLNVYAWKPLTKQTKKLIEKYSNT